jgi:hypothetical protein
MCLLPQLANGNKQQFVKSAYYASLRPHLQKEIRDKLEAANSIHVSLGSIDDYYSLRVSEEIARLEKHWKLV